MRGPQLLDLSTGCVVASGGDVHQQSVDVGRLALLVADQGRREQHRAGTGGRVDGEDVVAHLSLVKQAPVDTPEVGGLGEAVGEGQLLLVVDAELGQQLAPSRRSAR